jgi:hypothetical protein
MKHANEYLLFFTPPDEKFAKQEVPRFFRSVPKKEGDGDNKQNKEVPDKEDPFGGIKPRDEPELVPKPKTGEGKFENPKAIQAKPQDLNSKEEHIKLADQNFKEVRKFFKAGAMPSQPLPEPQKQPEPEQHTAPLAVENQPKKKGRFDEFIDQK